MRDTQTGIAIRFVQSWDIVRETQAYREDSFNSVHDAALFLMMRDKRDVSAAQKLADAYTFLSTMAES